jgi:hypothetical protein
MVELLVVLNNELEITWKDVHSLLEVLSRNLPAGTEENRKKPLRIASVPDVTRALHLPNDMSEALSLKATCSIRWSRKENR